MLTVSDCAKVLASELVFFPTYELSEPLIRAWASHFKDVEPAEFSQAFRQAIQEPGRKFAPTPGEIRAIINNLRAGPEELELPEAAWVKLLNNDFNVSNLALTAFKLTSDSSRMRFIPLVDLPWKKREFLGIYESLRLKRQQFGDKFQLPDSPRAALPQQTRQLIADIKSQMPIKTPRKPQKAKI